MLPATSLDQGNGPSGAATAGVLALLLGTWALGSASSSVARVADLPRAAPRQEETTVYLLPGADGKAPTSVLVPPDLLERLDRRPAPPSLPGAVLVSADYQGTVKKLGDRIARFEAVFRVYCPGPGPATLELPLDGKNLVTEPEVLVGGARASLTALPPPRIGYALKLAGQGLREVRVVFHAEISGLTDDRSGGGLRELQFSIPRVAQSRLSLRLPKGSAFPQALVKLGAQRVTEDNMGLLLEADFGAPLSAERLIAPARAVIGTAAVPVHLRWRQPQPGERPRVRFKESYLWDLGQRGHTLTAVLVFTVDQGAVSRLIVDVPPELLVGRVEARRPVPPGPVAPGAVDEAAVRLRDWHLEAPPGGGRPGLRPLHLDFQAPVSGEVAVLLALYPRDGLFNSSGTRPGAAGVTLPVPRPHGTPLPQEGYLAYRLQGLEARRIDNLRVEGVKPDAFPAFFWQTAGRGGTPAYTCRILREGTEGPKLTLAVRPAPARRDGKLNVHWRIGNGTPTTAGRADFSAVLDLSAPDGDLALVEWEVPAGVEVAAVTGREVREWSLLRGGGGNGRLQVWLRRAVDGAHLEVLGSTPLARLPVPERKWLPAGSALSLAMQETLTRSGLFVLPALRVIGMERTPPVTEIKLSAADDTDLVALSPPGKDDKGLFLPRSSVTLRPSTVQYGGARFAVVPARLPSVRLVTTLDVIERQFTFQTRVEVVSPDTSLRALGLRVDNWRGPAPRLEAPGGRQRSEEHGKGLRTWRSWSVEWDEGVGTKVLTLSGKMPLEEALTAEGELPGEGLPVPVVRVPGAVSVNSWLLLGKGAARFRPYVLAAGDSSVAPRPLRPEPLSAETGRQEQGWRLDVGSSSARQTVLLVREEAPGDAPPVRVVLREQTSAAPDGRRWLHETTWWLYHPAPTDLLFTLPDGVVVLGVSVDGRDHPFTQGDRETANEGEGRAPNAKSSSSPSLLVSLSGEGARRVSLRWQHRDGSEEFSRPSLRGPRLQSERESPTAWTLHVPAGLNAPPGAFRPGSLAAARVELRCAEMQLRLTKLLLESTARLPARKGTRTIEAQLSDCQRRFALCCRNAEQLLRTAPQTDATARERGAGERAADAEAGQPRERVAELQERLESLQRENRKLTEENGLGTVRREAERLARRSGPPDEGRTGGASGAESWDVESLAVSGRPFYRLSGGGAAGSVEGTAPLLVTSAGLEWRRAVGATALLFCGLMAVWL
ncbi:MAG TPA: hypothetical protein VKD72_31485, partial [Gemmataceae bacterium]|nr:hypothetical protein [Gemmataceae bacterium]